MAWCAGVQENGNKLRMQYYFPRIMEGIAPLVPTLTTRWQNRNPLPIMFALGYVADDVVGKMW